MIIPDDSWFHTPHWQEKEKQADADLRAGRLMTFGSGEAFLAALEIEIELGETMSKDERKIEMVRRLRAQGHEVEFGEAYKHLEDLV